MKKFFIVLAFFTLFSAVSCDSGFKPYTPGNKGEAEKSDDDSASEGCSTYKKYECRGDASYFCGYAEDGSLQWYFHKSCDDGCDAATGKCSNGSDDSGSPDADKPDTTQEQSDDGDSTSDGGDSGSDEGDSQTDDTSDSTQDGSDTSVPDDNTDSTPDEGDSTPDNGDSDDDTDSGNDSDDPQQDENDLTCEEAALKHSYKGCDFFTTIFMYTKRTDPIFGLTISNASKNHSVNISIKVSSESCETDAGPNYFCIDNDSDENCTSQTSSLSLSIEPGKLGIVMFPNDRNIKGQGMKWDSLHIKTDFPVTIYQFSPIDNSDQNPFESSGTSVDGTTDGKSSSNDASLLIPTPSVYTDYIVSAHDSGKTTYATIIGISDKDTVVTVKPTVTITDENGIPAIEANTEGTITLKKGQVAQIQASSDLSGSRIYCDTTKSNCHPFVVFSGVDCANIPKGYGYCDHIEQQLFPVQTLGKKYVLVKSQARGEEWDYVRIYASKNGTTLTFKPATPEKISVPSGWTSFTVNDVKTALNAGEYSEFYFKGTLEVESNNQIMVAQYLTASQMISKSCQSSLTHSDECVGDPAMMLIPPAEQFRKDYLFLTPGSYVSNFATIIMKKGETPLLDGNNVTDIHEIEDSNFSYAIVDLGSAFANHTLTCKNPCGLFVYGWEQDVSYAYPGGLNFEKLSTN